ncbi:uncharacterized protein LOC128671267 [Plodia interpunctella]|uniref:uncharacterized protein LOC128671267 n=1 Tax=Plodia interpunctella TaxID=58824 RepID=UPI0023685541|nr:uncharacterized protein LOC128671267 [Plodia interpunctella]
MASNCGTCAGCQNLITDKEYLICFLCRKQYDLICANVSQQRFYNTLTGEHRLSWQCVCCVSKKPKSDNTNTPVRGVSDGVNLNRGAAACNLSQNLDDSSALNDTLDMTDMQVFLLEARQWREEMKAMRVQLGIFTTTIAKLTEKLEDSDRRCNQLEGRVNSLENQISELNSNSDKSLLATIEQLKSELNDRDQDSLGNDLEISNIPEDKGENLLHIVTAIADKLSVNMTVQDIVSATRVGRSAEAAGVENTRHRPIVVRVVRRALRDELLRSARVRRGATTEGIGLPAPHRRFYINERLTKTNRFLFSRARELGKSRGWRYVWTKDGKIFARRDSHFESPRHRIRGEKDLVKIFPTEIVSPSNL